MMCPTILPVNEGMVIVNREDPSTALQRINESRGIIASVIDNMTVWTKYLDQEERALSPDNNLKVSDPSHSNFRRRILIEGCTDTGVGYGMLWKWQSRDIE